MVNLLRVTTSQWVSRITHHASRITHHASRSFSSFVWPKSSFSALALLAVSITGVTGSEGVFGIHCFLKNSTSWQRIFLSFIKLFLDANNWHICTRNKTKLIPSKRLHGDPEFLTQVTFHVVMETNATLPIRVALCKRWLYLEITY